MTSEGYDGWPVLDEAGQRIGKVDELYEDRRGHPHYIGMKAGLLGASQTLLPAELVDVDEAAQQVRTPWSRERIKAAPRHDGDEPIGAELQRMFTSTSAARIGPRRSAVRSSPAPRRSSRSTGASASTDPRACPLGSRWRRLPRAFRCSPTSSRSTSAW